MAGPNEVSETTPAGGGNLRSEGSYRDPVEAGWCRFVQSDICKWGGITGCRHVTRMIADTDSVRLSASGNPSGPV